MEGQLCLVDGVDGPQHQGNGVDPVHILARRVPPPDVQGKHRHSAVLGHNVVGPVRLGNDGGVGLVTPVDQVFGSHAALELTQYASDHDVSGQTHPGSAYCLGCVDHSRHAAFHVAYAGAVEAVALFPRIEGIPGPTGGQRVDVQVAV